MKKMGSVLIVILVLLVFGLAGCKSTPPPPPPTPSETVNLGLPLYIIEGENQVGGVKKFCDKLESFYGDENVGLLGGYPLVEGVEKYFESIKVCNSILIVPPFFQEYRDLENKYPDLCPLSCDNLESELESHSSPLLYFSQDIGADKIRGIIVANHVNPTLAELLGEGVPLDVSFRYENGQLQILE